MASAQSLLTPASAGSANPKPIASERLPLPILLRVPYFPGHGQAPSPGIAPAPAPPRGPAPRLRVPTSQPIRPALHRSWWPTVFGALILIVLALTPSVIIHWEDWGFGPWFAQMQASWQETDASGRADDANPTAVPKRHKSLKPTPAQLAPYIIPVDGGTNP